MERNEEIIIPKINQKIEKELKRLKLKPDVPPKKFLKIHRTQKHRYFSPCLTKDKKRVAFYARLHNLSDAKEKFIREIDFYKKIGRVDLEIKKIIPKIFNYGIENDFEWLVREYPKGNPLGHSRNLTQKLSPGLIQKIIKAILEIPKIPPKNFSKLKK